MRLASLSLLSPALLALAAPLAACGSSDPGGQPPAVDGATPDGSALAWFPGSLHKTPECGIL